MPPTDPHIDDATAGTEAATIAELAFIAATPERLDPAETYSVVVPDRHRVELLDLEHRLDAPTRPRGTYHPATVDAFISHVDRHRDADRTTVWVHPTSGRIVAVLNDNAAHAVGETGWRDHRSQLDLKHTDEWLFWTAKDGQMMSQVDFAEHIEDGTQEIADPPAADMLELAQSFQASQAAAFRSAHRLSDGTVQVQYEETVDAAAGRSGQLAIPQTFTLAIAPFLGEDPYRVTARLRYRLSGGTLRLGYRLERPDAIVRDALTSIADRLTDRFTDVYLGEPA